MKNLHYYSKEQEDLESNPTEFTFNYKDNTFKFTTDNGVFSKAYIDYGSFALLNAFKPNNSNSPILDMGAGYGALGLTISRLYNKEVYLAEINSRAYNLIIKNAKANNIDNIKVFHSDLYEEIPSDVKFSSVITNPPIRAGKSVVHAIYDGAYNCLEIGGELWVVIQKKQGAPSSKEHIEKLFGSCEIVTRDKGYYILRAVKKEFN